MVKWQGILKLLFSETKHNLQQVIIILWGIKYKSLMQSDPDFCWNRQFYGQKYIF